MEIVRLLIARFEIIVVPLWMPGELAEKPVRLNVSNFMSVDCLTTKEGPLFGCDGFFYTTYRLS